MNNQKVFINAISLSDDEKLVFDSDCNNKIKEDECVIKKLGRDRNCEKKPFDNNSQEVINFPKTENIDENKTNVDTRLKINNLSIDGNTSDVTFGNKYIFDGNVIIEKFVVEKSESNHIISSHTGKNDVIKDNTLKVFEPNDDNSVRSSGTLGYKLKNYKNVIVLSGTIIILGVVLAVFGWRLNERVSFDYIPSQTVTQLGDGDDFRKNIPINSSIGSDIIAPGKFLRIISRSEWLAQPPNGDLANLTLPVHRVIIAHTATEPCDTQAQCTFRVRYIQTFHIESRDFDDIAYNYLVGGDGAVYEGRGWDKQGAHTKGFNVDSICISFIGTFNTIKPPNGQLNAAKLIIQEGLRQKKLDANFKLYGHRQLIATESPGVSLYKIIQTWKHFATELPSLSPIKKL